MGSRMENDDKVEAVLNTCSPEVRQMVENLRELVRNAAPKAEERGYTGWGNIVYVHNGMFCYIGPQKDSVNLGFHRGLDLTDPEGLLLGTGKGMRHVKVRNEADIRVEELTGLVREAYRLSRG